MQVEDERGAARSRLLAWSLYDFANSAFPTVIQTFVFAAYFTRRVAEDEAGGTAQWGTALGLAGLLVALGAPLLGAFADQSGRRKPWIAVLTLLCVAATALLWFVEPSPEWIWPALLLVGLGTVGAELAALLYNAMLPGLAGRDRMGRWSGWAWGLGYLGGLACLVVALLGFVMPEPWVRLDRESAEHVRATFLLAAGWYLVFSLPLLLGVPDEQARRRPARESAAAALRQLRDTAREARRHAPLIRFLVAHLVFTDGLAALFAFGGVLAAGTFAMTEQEVLAFGIALNVSAGLGAFAMGWLADRWSSKAVILIALVGLTVLGGAAVWAPSAALFWTFGILLGLFVGPVQAASRSYLGQVAPPELRNQMFGLYAFSGKATAFLAPILVGWVAYAAQSQRVGMSVILVYFLVGLALMWSVPSDRARGVGTARGG